MLRLKARQSAMRKVAQAAILEVRLFVDVQPRKVYGVFFRDDVAVPEPVAARAPLKEVIDAIKDASQIRACDCDSLC